MRPSAPRPSRTTPRVGSYTTRLLLGYTLSLGTLLLLVHLSVSPPPVPPWLPSANPDRIQLSQIQEASSEETGSDASGHGDGTKIQDEAPPQTRHTSPPPSSAPSTGTDRRETRRTRARANLESITTLTETNPAELIGGIRAYYLKIRYPEPARKKGIQGRLMLRFTVTPSGTPKDIHVSRSLHPLLDTAAVRALRTVRFRPATQNGLPVSMPTKLPVRFRLLSDSSRIQTAGGPSTSSSSDTPNQ
jgi:protein TonB